VEDDAFEVAAPRMPDEVFHRFWRVLGEQADVDIALTSMYSRRVGSWRGSTRSRRRNSSDGLLVSCRALVENVTITLIFLVSVH